MPQPTARRRSADHTRAAILEAARARFAADGYDRATIRAIAADAEIDPAMVMRYFGSKEGLFVLAAEFDVALPDLSALPPENLGSMLARHFLQVWERDGTFMALLRAAATNEPAADRMRAVFAEQVAPSIGRMAPDRFAERAGLVASQLLGVALGRYVLRLPPLASMSDAELVDWLGPTLQRYLTAEQEVTDR
jgi:AcrR family transcriptional regulator